MSPEKCAMRANFLTDPAVSEWALWFNHGYTERMVSLEPDAHKVLLLAHALRVSRVGKKVAGWLSMATDKILPLWRTIS